jgi:FkbM family methyltransferase
MGRVGVLALLCMGVLASALTAPPGRPISSDEEQIRRVRSDADEGSGNFVRWSTQSSHRDTSFNGTDWFVKGKHPFSGQPRTPWVFSTPQCPKPEGAESWSQYAEDQHLYHNYFCGKRNGTFVEMGALDGVYLSNTKFFEDHMGWTGALIEASPPSAEKLRENRGQARNSIFGEAVCAKGTDHIDFLVGDTPATNSEAGVMPDSWVDHFSQNKPNTVKVPCRPLGEMLTDMLKQSGAEQIDLFSLDVEGGELKVLETMDWSVKVGLWFIEYNGGRPWKLRDLLAIMEPNGYKLVPAEAWMTNNAVFVPVSFPWMHNSGARG